MLLFALVLQPLLPAAALSVRAAPLSVTPRQEPPPDPPDPPVVYDEPFAEILPPALSIDGSTPTITLPNLMATVNLDLDRAVLIHGATAALTITVQGDYATLPAGVTLSLTLPPGLVTSAGATGVLQWPLLAASQSSLFVQSIQLQVDQAALPTPAAVVDLAVQLSAPGYATGYWSATLGIAPVVDSSPIVTTQQDTNGAVLQDGTGLLTLLVEPTAVEPGTTFTYTELYRWDQQPVTTTTGVTPTAATLPSDSPNPLTVQSPLSGNLSENLSVTSSVTATATANYRSLLPLVVGNGQPDGAITTDEQSPIAAAPGANKKPKPQNDEGVQLYYSWQLDATQDKKELKQFKKPIKAAISLAKLAAAGIDPISVQLWTRKKAKSRWEQIATDYDAKRQALIAYLPHFSQFGLGAGLSQRGEILPSVVGFTTDRLTGGVSLQYPIETPAGVGGLKPNLSFVYSSLSADDLFLDSRAEYLAQTSGVGMGWSVAGSANFIVRTDNKLDNNTTDILKTFSLVLNGAQGAPRVSIRFEENEWRTDPETFYKVVWPGASSGNVDDWSGWTLVAPDGTKYEFGDDNAFTGNADSISTSPTITYLETSSGGTVYRLANQWYLRRVTDPLGNQIDYKYKTEKSKITTNDCMATIPSLDRWYTSAVYPTEVLWNQNSSQGLAAGLHVLFTYDAAERLDYAIKYSATNECDQVKFAKNDRLSSVKVEAKVGTSWVTQRTYSLGNSYRFTASATTDQLYTATSGGTSIKRLLLHSIAVAGKSGGTLHTYAFTYQKQGDNNPNQVHLVTADNGWGGKTTYTLVGHRVHCPSNICGGDGVRDTRFAVTQTRVEDGLGNSLYTTYFYSNTNAPSGAWGHIGLEDGSAQFFGFERSQATYYATVSGSATFSTVLKWDDQTSWPPAQSEGNADPRTGKPKRLEVRASATGAIVAVTTYNWQAYRRVNGLWQTAQGNQLVVNGNTTYPIIWVRQEAVDTWTAAGTWTSTYKINGSGHGQLTKTVYDNTATARGYGNVTAVEEFSNKSSAMSITTWSSNVAANSGLNRIRTTATTYVPNVTAYIVNKPARVRVYAGTVNSPCKAETRYVYGAYYTGSVYTSNVENGYTTVPLNTGLLVKTEQALVACSDAATIAKYDATWAITRMAYDSYGNQTTVNQLGNDSGGTQDLKINTSYDSTYRLFPVSQDINGSTTYKETATYYGVNEITGHSGVSVWGAMQEHCGVNELCTRQTYDQFGRPVGRWEAVVKSGSWGLVDSAAQVAWLYNVFGGTQTATTVTEWHNPRLEGNFTRKLYNGLGQLVQEQTPYQNWGAASGAQQEVIVDYLYDALGHQTRASTPWLTARHSSGDLRRTANWSSYTRTDYDAGGAMYQRVAPNGEQQRSNYTGRSLEMVGVGRNGDANKVLAWQETNGLGQLKLVRTYPKPAAEGGVVEAQVTLTNTVLGNLTDVVHPNSIAATTLTYDMGGRKTAMTDPDLGSWSYDYDRQGKLIRQTDARKQTTCLYYDTFARLSVKHFRNDSALATVPPCPASVSSTLAHVVYTYDENHSSSNRSRGQLTKVVQQNNTIISYQKELSYNAQGLLASENVYTIAGLQGHYATAYTYDAYLRPSKTIYPDGEEVTLEYNAMGLPRKLTSSLSTSALVDSVSYDAAGRPTLLSFPAGGNLWRRYTYAPFNQQDSNGGQLTTAEVGTGVSGVYDNRMYLDYAYDSFGNIKQVRERFGAAGTLTTSAFTYDTKNRLLTGYGQSYTNDGAGRLTAYEGTSYTGYRGHAVTQSSGSGQPYTYDTNGNMTSRYNPANGVSYTLDWDRENHLSRVSTGSSTVESYLYDPNGMRMKKASPVSGSNVYYINPFFEITTPFVVLTAANAPCDPEQTACTPPAQSSASNRATYLPLVSATGEDAPTIEPSAIDDPLAPSAKYYYFNGQRVAMRQPTADYLSSTLSYLHNDHLGGTTLVTKADGTLHTNQGYRAYGRDRINGLLLPTDHKFTGQKLDTTGLYYYGSRYYDPELGQFISPDTIVPDPSNLLDYNRYMYVRGNPMKYNDPTGHCTTLGNGNRDLKNDSLCWGLADAIAGYGQMAGYGHAEQEQFAADWKVSPEAWLKDIASADYATVAYLTPFFAKYQTTFNARTGVTHGVDNPVTNQDQAFEKFVRAVECDNPVGCITNTLDGVSAGGALVAAVCTVVSGGVCAVIAGPATAVSITTGGLGVSWTAYQAAQGNGTGNDLAVTGSTFTIGAARSIGSKTLGKVNAWIGAGASLFQWYYDNYPPTYPSSTRNQ